MQRVTRSGLPDASQRLFFALWPGEAIRHAVADAVRDVRAVLDPQGRAIDAARYHMTLQYLGGFRRVPDSLLEQACRAGSDLQVPGFDMTLDCLGSFDNRQIVWWLGCRMPPAALLALWDALGRALSRHGNWRQPAAFSPHVTIVRNARSPVVGITAPIAWPVRDVVLLRSGQPGGGYDVIGQWPLQRP